MKRLFVKFVSVICVLAAIFSLLCVNAAAVTGDVDKDGLLKSSDARLALRYSLRLQNIDSVARRKADVNADGKVNSADARLILRAAMRLDNLDHFSNYYMRARFTNSSTGTVTELDTAWYSGKVLIKIDDITSLVYDSVKNTVAIVNHRDKQYSLMSFADFKKKYPQNSAYFAGGAKELCWSDNLPKPAYLIDEGYLKQSVVSNGETFSVYRKNFSNGSQIYTFNSFGYPVKSEFYAGNSLMTLEFFDFSDNPASIFSVYLNYRPV